MNDTSFDFLNFNEPDYPQWFSKEKWTSREAAILFTGGNPIEVDWERDIENSERNTATKLVDEYLWIRADNPDFFIKRALGIGITIYPPLYKWILENKHEPKISTKSILYKYYAFWAKMDTWTIKQALYLLVNLDISEKNIFMSATLYPERERLYEEILTILKSSVAANLFTADPAFDKAPEFWKFKPFEIIKWAYGKGYQYPPLLLQIMGYNEVRKPCVSSSYTTPFLDILLKAASELGESVNNMKVKHELVPWFENELEKISGQQELGMNNKAKVMATLIRMPEKQKGGNTKRPKNKV